MSADKKQTPDRGRTDKIKGKAKEAAGKVTGKDDLRREGQTDQAGGKAKEKGNEAIDQAKDAFSDKE